MFFSTVWSSFKGFKCVIQKLQKLENFGKPKKNNSKVCQQKEMGFGQIPIPKR